MLLLVEAAGRPANDGSVPTALPGRRIARLLLRFRSSPPGPEARGRQRARWCRFPHPSIECCDLISAPFFSGCARLSSTLEYHAWAPPSPMGVFCHRLRVDPVDPILL